MPLTGTPSGTGMSISSSLSWRVGSGFSLAVLDAFDSSVVLISFGFFDVFSALAVFFGDGAGVPCWAASDPKARAQASAKLRGNFATDAGE